jgi:hypothetical protein
MRLILPGILLMCLSCAAQDDGAVLLHRAAHCIAAKGFLPSTKATKVTFGYFLDEKSYPGEAMLYVVNYPDPSRPDGFVFTVFPGEHNGHQNFNIQNNTRFTVSKDGDVSFVEAPLGGSWTQRHLVFAIKEIEERQKFTIPLEKLLAGDPSFSCEAYNDPQRSPATK